MAPGLMEYPGISWKSLWQCLDIALISSNNNVLVSVLMEEVVEGDHISLSAMRGCVREAVTCVPSERGRGSAELVN